MIAPALVSQLKSRQAAIAAGAIAAALLLIVLSAPVVAMFRAQDGTIDDSLHQLGVLRAEAATRPAIEEQLRTTRQNLQTLQGAIRAASASLAQSQMQQVMEGIASANASTIRSSQMLPTTKDHGFDTVAIQYDAAVPMSKLRDLFYAVETHVPYLFIDNVQISGGRSAEGDQAGKDTMLDVRLSVRAYRWGERA